MPRPSWWLQTWRRLRELSERWGYRVVLAPGSLAGFGEPKGIIAASLSRLP